VFKHYILKKPKVEVQHIFVLGRSNWSSSHTSCFIFGKIASGIHWIGNWVNARASVDIVCNINYYFHKIISL